MNQSKRLSRAVKFVSEPPDEVVPDRIIIEHGDDGSLMYFIEQGTIKGQMVALGMPVNRHPPSTGPGVRY